jgi:hypothetical protein
VTFYEEHNTGISCPGQSDFSVDAESALTVCFELINTGDQTLADLTLTDTGLGIDTDTDLIEVFGTLADPLQPGQSIVLAFEVSPERDLRLRTRAGGQPTAIEGGDPAGPPVSTIRNHDVGVRPGDEAPGFGDGFDSGKRVLAAVWSVARVVTGFAVPLLALAPFALAALWFLSLLRRRRAAGNEDRLPPPPPPAPAATPTPNESAPNDPAPNDPAPNESVV